MVFSLSYEQLNQYLGTVSQSPETSSTVKYLVSSFLTGNKSMCVSGTANLTGYEQCKAETQCSCKCLDTQLSRGLM